MDRIFFCILNFFFFILSFLLLAIALLTLDRRLRFNVDYFLFNVSLLLLIIALLSHIIDPTIIIWIILENFIISAYLLRGKDKLQKNEEGVIRFILVFGGLIYFILVFSGVTRYNGHVPAPPDPIFYMLLGIAITGLVGVNLLKHKK